MALAIIGPGRLIAQIEGERGIPPVASTTDIEVDGIAVDTTGKTGEEARQAGWKLAQRLAWEKVGAAKLSDGDLDAMVSAIVVQQEQIGPRRYIATLGVIFDRAKAGELVAAANGGGQFARSAPLLVIPILDSGGTRQVFEVRGPWQRAWANFQTSASPIDYVRPTGSGGESLLVTAGQPGRRSRLWWRNVLDQFGASDVIMPVARLERQWPGGPVRGTFTARYGPDNLFLDSFTLTAPDDRGITRMLNEALVRIDLVYRGALARGQLRPDPSLTTDQRAYQAVLAQLRAQIALLPAGRAEPGTPELPSTGPTPQPSASASAASAATYTIQFASPDAATLDAVLAAVRSAPGVQGASVTSLAVGGTSLMRVTLAGDLEGLATALRARGYQASVSGSTLSVRR
ncbi:MAG: heavy-metal-associated domain-containing protein [Novosphingobium sp.]